MTRRVSAHLSTVALAFSAAGLLWLVLACGTVPKVEAPPPAPAPAAPPAPAGGGEGARGQVGKSQCAKDIECKGDRICEQGQCVAPH